MCQIFKQIPHQRRYIQIGKYHVKSCFISVVIRGMQIKTKMRYHYIAIGVAKIQNSNNECW